ncbi:hypothetical protein, partial [Methylotenera sp.]|uniref:hypothetical protein n=1 Tax=Methylotenera sp. TaxID=2051956 RepID=UPI0027305634
VCNFASSILITMLCIMTDLELQLFNSDSFLGGNTQHLQTHFILEEAINCRDRVPYEIIVRSNF